MSEPLPHPSPDDPTRTTAGAPPQPASKLGPGARLGPFRIVRELGAGGMGAVYEAEDPRAGGRRVALKVARREASGRDAERFPLEAQAAARLSHPNLVKVHELGEERGLRYMALELVEGPSLAERVAGGQRLDPQVAARIARDLARGLAYAHDQGVLHRDLKPANVLLTVDGAPRLTDFGLAKALDRSQALTRTGDLLGTPTYMAPEQADGLASRADARVDVYGLGATLYCLLTGRPPFVASSLPGLLTQIMTAPARSPSELAPEVPRALSQVVLRCLEKEPADRYPDMHALADALDAFLDGALGEPPASRLRWGILAVGLLALAGGVAAVLASRGAPAPAPRATGVASATPPPTPAAADPSPSPEPTQTPQGTWRKATDTGPPARWLIQHGATWAQGKLWVFGGWRGQVTNRRSAWLNDLWSWDGTRWEQVERGGPNRRWPPPRGNHVFVYHEQRKSLVLWGGRRDLATPLLGDVWEFDLGRRRWTVHRYDVDTQPPPRPRGYMGATYDPRLPAVLVFGGAGAEELQPGNLWGWDGRWHKLPEMGRKVHVRRHLGMAFDPVGRRVLIGGGNQRKTFLNVLHAYERGEWLALPHQRTLADVPPARSANTLVMLRGRPVLFGGYALVSEDPEVTRRPFQDLHVYELERGWRELKPAGPLPAPRAFHGSAVDPRSGELIVFGGGRVTAGWREAEVLGDTWIYTPPWQEGK